MTEVIHRIDRAFAEGVIEVYGDPANGWYEWRILERGAVVRDTATAGYGSPVIALRDALNHDEPRPGVNREALDGVAAGLANLAGHYRQMAAHHEIKAKPVPSSELDSVADSLELMRRHLLDAMSPGTPPQGDAIVRAWEALGGMATALEGTPEGDRAAELLRDARDAIAGDGRWPEPADLSDEFKANVATWQYKGNLWGGLHLVKDVSGMIHPMVADYVHLETMHSGGLYGTWAEAFAAFGAALDAWEK